jgi:hypothetical protein
MLSTQKNIRPNCDQILCERNSWALSLKELEKDSEFEFKRKESLEENFHLYFIRMKLQVTKVQKNKPFIFEYLRSLESSDHEL